MFELRLKRIMLALAIMLVVILVRLVELQVVRADVYRQRAEAALLRPAKTLPFVRGRILDRFGRVLAADEPCWQISVDYKVLSGEAGMDDAQVRSHIERMWDELAAFSGEPVDDLHERADAIVRRIQRWREHTSTRLGYDVPIREERLAHPIVTELGDQEQIAARERFAAYAWVKIEHGVRRHYESSKAWPHILGRIGAVDADAMRDDPNSDDPLARYEPTEDRGLTGVEYLAEQRLRGRRGRLRDDRGGDVMEHMPAQAGEDVVLSIRFDLQEALYALLAQRVPELCPWPAGGTVVVLDVAKREVLAMVSYPGFDNNHFRRQYRELRADTLFTPLRFRAVANTYEPGSIVKPLTCLAGVGAGVISVDTTFNCTGYLFENTRDAWRCWPIAGTKTRKAHGDVDVSGALCGSCNVYMYHVANLLGVNSLTSYFEMAGFGRTTGIGLREEHTGINPTPHWLMTHRDDPATPGRARNFAIGQGELSVTPLQAANLVALYGAGTWRPVTLLRDDEQRPQWRLPANPAAWHAIREGLYRVTNDPNGTAYRTAHWTDGSYALCGKTGSATTPEAPTHYRIEYTDPDGRTDFAIVPAKMRAEAVAEFKRTHREASFDPQDAKPYAWWPPKRKPDDEKYAHAWLAGYLQSVRPGGEALLDRTPPIAFAVLVEFGGSGGYTTGPIARDIAAIICRLLGPDLDPDYEPGDVG